MEKKLIFENANEAKGMANAWNVQKQNLQRVIDLYNATGLPDLAGNELHSLFNDTDHFLFDKITNGEQAHLTIGTGVDRGHIAIDKTQAINMLVKPTGYNELVQCIKDTSEIIAKGSGANPTLAAMPAQNIGGCFVIDDSGNLQFSDRVQGDIDEAGKKYIASEAGKKVIAFVEDVAKAYYANGIDTLQKGVYRRTIGQIMEDVVTGMNDGEKTFVFNQSFLTTDRSLENLEKNK